MRIKGGLEFIEMLLGLLDFLLLDPFVFIFGLVQDFFRFHFRFIGEAFGGQPGLFDLEVGLGIGFIL